MPALAARLRRGAGGGAAGELFHGLGQCVHPWPSGARRVAAGARRQFRHRRDRDPVGRGVRRHGVCDRGLRREGRSLPAARRGRRDQLSPRRLPRCHEALHRRARRRCGARHGRGTVRRAQHSGVGDGRAAGADRLPAGLQGGKLRPDAGDDAAADHHRLDDAAAHDRAEGRDRAGVARERLAGAGAWPVRPGDFRDVPARRGGGRACVDGEQHARRQDRAARGGRSR